MSKRKFLIPLTAFSLLFSTLVACGGGGKGTSKPADSTTSQGGGTTTTSQGGASTTSQGGASTTSQGGASTTSQGGASTTSQGGGQASLFEEVADPAGHHFGAEEDVAADAESGAVAYKKAACSDTDCNYAKLRINQSQVTYASGSSNKSGTPEGYVKLGGNGQSLSFKFKVDKLSMGKLYFLGRMDGYSTDSNKTVGIYRQGSPNIEVKINGKAADLSSKASYKYSDTFGEEAVSTGLESPSNYLSHEGYVEICDLTLNEGVNEVIYTRKASQNMIVRDFVFVVEPHTHSFPEEWTEAKAPTYTELGSAERVCACGEKEQKDLNTLPFVIGDEAEAVKLNSDGKKVSQFTYNNGAAKVAAVAMKQNSGVFKTVAVEGETEKWTIGDDANKAAADTYKLDKGNALLFKVNVSAAIDNAFISIGAKYVNANARHFYNHLDGGTNGDKDTEDAYRYYTKVNDGEFQPIAFNDYMSAIFGDGSQIAYMPLGKFNLKAGENLIYVRQGNIGYRVTLQGNLFVALSGDAQVAGDDAVPQEVAGAYPTFKWSEAVQEDSATLDGTKFKTNSTYSFKVKNVPAAGTYTVTLPMKGSNGNGAKKLNGDGQGFSISANDVPGTFYGDGKTYEEFFGADQNSWVDVLFGEVALNAGTNLIKITTNSGGYRVSLNAEGNVTIAEPVFAGYSVTFTTEHCKVLVYEGKKYDQTPVETNTTVAMDEDGNVVPYDIEDELPQPQVNFKVVCDEGYSVTAPDNFTITGTYKNLKQNPAKSETPAVDDDTLFRITKVQTDLTVAIVAVEGESAPGKAGAFETEHCSVKVYVGPKEVADRVEDVGPIFYARDKVAPYDVVKTGGQLNFVVTCDDNYEFVPEIDADEKVSFIEGTYKAFKDDGDGCYRITNVQSDLRINIVATATGGQQVETRVIDFSLKTVSHSAYNDTWAYGDATVAGGANNNGQWAFVKMGGKSSTISAENHPGTWIKTDVAVAYSVASVTMKFVGKCYNQDSEKATVKIEAYSDADLTAKVAETAAQEVPAIADNDGVETLTFAFATAPAANMFYKINFDIINTTNYNGVVALESVTFNAAGAQPAAQQPVGQFHGLAKTSAGTFLPVDMDLAADSLNLYINGEAIALASYEWDGVANTLTAVSDGAYGTVTASYAENVFTITGVTGMAAAALDSSYEVKLSGNCQFLDCEQDTATLQNIFLRRKMGSSWEAANADDKLFSSNDGKMGKGVAMKCWADGKIALTLKSDLNISAGNIKSVGCWIYNPSATQYSTTLYYYKGAGNTSAQQAKVFTLAAQSWTFCQCGISGLLADTDTFYNFQFYTANVNTTLVFDNFCLYM